MSPAPHCFAAWTRTHGPDSLAVALMHCWRRVEVLGAACDHDTPLRLRARRHGQLNPEARRGIPTEAAAAASVRWLQDVMRSVGDVEAGLRRRAEMDALFQALVATRSQAGANGGGV